jgi:hypothetical protein
MQTRAGGDSLAVKIIGSVGALGVGGGITTNDGTFAKESGGHLAAIDTATAASKTDLDSIVTNTTGLATHTDAATLHTDLTTTNSDLSTINTTLGALGTQATLAAIKADLDTLVIDNADILADGDNLALIQAVLGNTSDTAATDTTSTWSQQALLRYLLNIVLLNHYDSNGNLKTTANNATFESSSGGPVNATGTPTGFSLDQKRNIQGKKPASGTLTGAANSGATAGDTQLIFTAAPLNLPSGAKIILSGGGNPQETVIATTAFAPGVGIVTVPLQNAVVNSGHTTATWDVENSNGPAGAMTALGLAIVENAIFDPNSSTPKQRYEPYAYTGDAVAGTNVPMVGLSQWNGATVDRVGSTHPLPNNITQFGGSTLSNTNPVPVQAVAQANYVALTSPPTATNAGSDTTCTFSSQVNYVTIINATGADVHYAFDVAATLGSSVLPNGQAILQLPKKVTAVHFYTAAAQNINGSTAGNLTLLGEL